MATCNGILIKYFSIPAKNAKIFLYTLRNLGKKGGKKMHLWPKLGNRSTARHGRAVKNHQNYMVHQSPTLERGDRPAMGFCLAHNFLKDLQAFVCFYFISTYFDKRSCGMRENRLVARSKTSPQTWEFISGKDPFDEEKRSFYHNQVYSHNLFSFWAYFCWIQIFLESVCRPNIRN